MSSVFMMDPTSIFKKFLRYNNRPVDYQAGFEAGMLAMALELITVVKTEESLPTAHEETISTVYTLLSGMGLDEIATEWYERLNDWRKPTFVPEPWPGATDVASEPHTAQHHEPSDSPSTASQEGPAPLGTAAPLGFYRSRDLPYDESEQQLLEALRSRPIVRRQSPWRDSLQADETE